VAERYVAEDKLVHDHTQRSEVDHSVVALALNNLGSHIVRRPNNSERPLLLRLRYEGRAEVYQHEVAGLVGDDVVRLEVAVHNLMVMH